MAIAVACPQCKSQFEIPNDLAEQLVRCQRCLCTFARESSSENGNQPASTQSEDQETLPRRPIPRPALPLVSVLIVLLGLLFLLLAISAGFNFWYILGPEMRRERFDEVRQMEMDARMQNEKAAQAAEAARKTEIQVRERSEALKRQNDELKHQVELLQKQLNDAK